MIARQTAVQTAISFKGKRTEIVDIYNSVRPLPLGYRVKYEDLLCATYVSAIFIKLGWTDIVPPNPRAWQLYENMAAIDCAVKDPNRVPSIGDLIFFGTGKKTTNIQHVGIVTEVQNGRQIYYYDINPNVGRHTCPVGYSYIWGYGIPDYASKDLEPIPEPEPHPDKPHVFLVGDLVTVNPGARWYRGQSIKLSVINDQWYIMQVSGDRAVLGMNRDETRNICSPIHTCDITLVSPIDPPVDESVTLTVTVKTGTAQLLQIMADGNHKTVGQIIDMLIADVR